MPGLSGPPGAVTAAPATPPTTAPTGPPTTAPATTPVVVPAVCWGVWHAAVARQITPARMSLRMMISLPARRRRPRANVSMLLWFSPTLGHGSARCHFLVGTAGGTPSAAMMIPHHQGAVGMARAGSWSGSADASARRGDHRVPADRDRIDASTPRITGEWAGQGRPRVPGSHRHEGVTSERSTTRSLHNPRRTFAFVDSRERRRFVTLVIRRLRPAAKPILSRDFGSSGPATGDWG